MYVDMSAITSKVPDTLMGAVMPSSLTSATSKKVGDAPIFAVNMMILLLGMTSVMTVGPSRRRELQLVMIINTPRLNAFSYRLISDKLTSFKMT